MVVPLLSRDMSSKNVFKRVRDLWFPRPSSQEVVPSDPPPKYTHPVYLFSSGARVSASGSKSKWTSPVPFSSFSSFSFLPINKHRSHDVSINHLPEEKSLQAIMTMGTQGEKSTPTHTSQRSHILLSFSWQKEGLAVIHV